MATSAPAAGGDGWHREEGITERGLLSKYTPVHAFLLFILGAALFYLVLMPLGRKHLGTQAWKILQGVGIALLFVGLPLLGAGVSVYYLVTGVHTVTANIGLALLGLCFWGIAVALWSVLGGSGSVGATSAVAVVAYFLNGLGASIDILEPFRFLSPFYWFLGDTVPLAKGLTWGYLALAIVAVGGTLYAMGRFRTRNLAV